MSLASRSLSFFHLLFFILFLYNLFAVVYIHNPHMICQKQKCYNRQHVIFQTQCVTIGSQLFRRTCNQENFQMRPIRKHLTLSAAENYYKIPRACKHLDFSFCRLIEEKVLKVTTRSIVLVDILIIPPSADQ